MINKYIKVFSIFILFLFPNVVGAAVLNDDDHEHILTVEKMTINNSDITFKGYSFISHMDNLGKTEWGIDPNLQTYLVVYTGEFNDDYIDKAGNCNKNECYGYVDDRNYFIKKATMTERDFFYSRCSNDGCSQYENIKNHRIDREEGLINDTSCHNGISDWDGKKNNECIYMDVGFSVTVDVENIVGIFTGGELVTNYTTDIKFAIVAYNTIIKEGLASGFNIHEKACYIGSKPCGDKYIKTARYEFELGDFATTVTYDATDAIPYTYEIKNNKINWIRYDGIFKQECSHGNCKYNIASNNNSKNFSNYFYSERTKSHYSCSGDENECGPYTDMFILLDTVECSSKLLCPDVSEDGDVLYYAPANHVTLEGEFKINTFKITMEQLTCDNIKGVNEKKNIEEKTHTCGSTKESVFYDCTESNEKVNGTIYYKDDNPKTGCALNNYKIVGGKYYLPVTVSADVLVIQEGKFKFDSFYPSTVNAGKGFSFKDASSGISYTNNVTFLIAGRYNNENDSLFYRTPYINYSAKRYEADCSEDLGFNINDEVRKYYKESGSEHGESKFYIEPGGSSVNPLFAANSVIGTSFLKSIGYFGSIDGNVTSGGGDIAIVSELFKFESCDSNSSKPTCQKISVNNGVWEEVSGYADWVRLDANKEMYIYFEDEWNANIPSFTNVDKREGDTSYRGFGVLVSRVYNYNLPYAYISLNDTGLNKYADVVYVSTKFDSLEAETNRLRYLGNKYFVGFKYDKKKFPFNLKQNNVSFVDKMDWQLSAICSVDVKDGYYDGGCDDYSCDGASKLLYGYRPISLKNPFPKFVGSNYDQIAKNWRDWYEDNSSRIIDMVYNNPDYADYEISLSKINNGSSVKISDINTDTSLGYYNQLVGYSIDGTSKFVEDKFTKRVISSDNGYCGLGLFSNNCDQAR